jgi:DNA-binding transcriptional regulator GbsR (MarR family)
MDNQSYVIKEFESLASEVGTFIEYWGFKKIHGKIWVHLFLSNNPLDAAELMRRLQISKALVSISLRDLMDYNVILQKGKSVEGTLLYVANANIGEVISNVIKQREKKMLTKVLEAQKNLMNLSKIEKHELNISDTKLKSLGKLVKNADSGIEALLHLKTFNLMNFTVE